MRGLVARLQVGAIPGSLIPTLPDPCHVRHCHGCGEWAWRRSQQAFLFCTPPPPSPLFTPLPDATA
jgi:hypothetical protein